MLPAPVPDDEDARLRALARYQILDTVPEREFDALTEIAAHILDVPIVLISIVAADRQWFKARHGLDVSETPRDVSFCGHAVAAKATLIVPDALADARFADNPLVTGDPHVRFYAGVPLETPEGQALGTLCAIDRQPRELTAEQKRLLEMLARQAIALLALRRRTLELEAAELERKRLTHEIVTLLDHMPALIGYWDKDLRNRHANKAYFQWFGLQPEVIRGMHIRDVIGEEMYALNLPRIEAALRGEAQVFYREQVGPDGKLRYSQATYIPDFANGEVRGFFVMFTDITERRLIENALFAEKETARTTLGAITEAVITADAAGRVGYLNPVAEQLTGWSQAAAHGQPIAAVLALRAFSGQSEAELLRAAIAGTGAVAGKRTAWLLRRDGSQLAVEYTLSALHGPEGEPTGAVVVAHDVSEAREQAIRMTRLAYHDALTGLPNRLLLHDRLEQAVEDARRGHARFAVVFIDLDEFKELSLALGEETADAVLRAVAQRLRASVRGSDTVSRFGGDEFVVLLSAVTDKASAVGQAAKLLDLMQEPLQVGELTVPASYSVGVSVYPDDDTDAATLLTHAEAAMQDAKRAGRNCLRVFAASAA